MSHPHIFFLLTIRILTASIGSVNNKNLNKEKKVMETISVTISTKDTEVLRKTGNYLRDLAGESQEATVTIKNESAPPTEVELDPEAEAAAMEQRMDNTIAAAGGAELDIDGRPWDVRIDSSAKTKTTDGRWKIARNKDKALVEQVKAELLNAVATPPPIVATQADLPVDETPAAPPVETAAITTYAELVPPVETAAITTYAELVPRITAMANTVPPVLQAHDVMDALNAAGAFLAGATNLTELAKPEHAGYIPLVAAELEKLWTPRIPA
jgi:hypothetical protein